MLSVNPKNLYGLVTLANDLVRMCHRPQASNDSSWNQVSPLVRLRFRIRSPPRLPYFSFHYDASQSMGKNWVYKDRTESKIRNKKSMPQGFQVGIRPSTDNDQGSKPLQWTSVLAVDFSFFAFFMARHGMLLPCLISRTAANPLVKCAHGFIISTAFCRQPHSVARLNALNISNQVSAIQ